jgi:hypothetical protein
MKNKKEIENKIKEAMLKDFNNLYVKNYTTAWETQRIIRGIEIKIMSIENLIKLFENKNLKEVNKNEKDI